MWVALAFGVGVVVGSVAGPVFWVVVQSASQAAFEVRFAFSADWQYCRTIAYADRPALWRWPWGAVRMWLHEFLFGQGIEVTARTYKNGVEFRRGRFGRAKRVH